MFATWLNPRYASCSAPYYKFHYPLSSCLTVLVGWLIILRLSYESQSEMNSNRSVSARGRVARKSRSLYRIKPGVAVSYGNTFAAGWHFDNSVSIVSSIVMSWQIKINGLGSSRMIRYQELNCPESLRLGIVCCCSLKAYSCLKQHHAWVWSTSLFCLTLESNFALIFNRRAGSKGVQTQSTWLWNRFDLG